MEGVLSFPESDVEIHRTGSLYAISYLGLSMVLIDTGLSSFNPDEAERIIKDESWNSLLSPKSIADTLTIQDTEREDRILLSVTPATLIPSSCHNVRMLESTDDYLSLIRLYRIIDSMADPYPEDDNDAARKFAERQFPFMAAGAFDNSHLVSAAIISAGTERNAMIAAVATDKECRNRGYASSVLSYLARTAFRRGIERLSLWPEQKAEGMYRKLGFSAFGWYTLFRRNEHELCENQDT